MAPTYTELAVEQRVANGAALLDRIKGPHWHDYVVPEYLHMSDCNQCVLGQTYGNFFTGLEIAMGPVRLGGTFHTTDEKFEFAYEHGFDVSSGWGNGADDSYEALEREWERVITARREVTSG